MPHNEIAVNVLGTIGTICWTGQLLPQLWKSWREKDTQGLSPLMLMIWTVSAVPLGAYSIVQHLSKPLILQPQLFMVLCTISWVQCMYYDRRWSKTKCLAAYIAVVAAMGGIEIGLYYAVLPAYNRGITAPITFLGIFSSVLIALGLVPQYWEIYTMGHVRGLSVPFIVIDCAGGLFNALSLVWKGGKFDILAGVCYSQVVVMDLIIVVAALVLNPRAKKRLAKEREEAGEVPPVVDADDDLEKGDSQSQTVSINSTAETPPLNELLGDSPPKAS